MDRIGVGELRQNASRYLARVKVGETVEVTDRGVLVALLVPPSESRSARDRMVATGALLPASGPLVFPPRVTPPPGTPTTEQILEDLREERL
ncbi:MAG: type II toxin-antitoxin system Phd/YefM family antitoxin [Iamia sp.]